MKQELEKNDKLVAMLDGDAVRATRHHHLGFTPEDIHENNRLVAEIAKEYSEQYDIVLVPLISPYRSDRIKARALIGQGFIEVYVNCPVAHCQKRDTKGLYAKATAGEIDNLIGVNTPYETPEHPDIEIFTGRQTPGQSVKKIMTYLVKYEIV